MATTNAASTQPLFRVLGALSIRTDHGYEPLLTTRPTAMLAALLTSPNEITSHDFLVRAVWGDAADVDGRRALRTCTARLRKLLVRHGLDEGLIRSVPGGYRLCAGPQDLDLMLFRESVLDAGRLCDPDDQIAGMRRALDLWDGELLCNVESDVLHRGVVPLLEEERLQVCEQIVTLQLRHGRDADALKELQPLTRTHPGHENFARDLIGVLHRAGRREDALAECARIKTYLSDELGLDTSTEIGRLEMAVLNGEPVDRPAAPVVVTHRDQAPHTQPPAPVFGAALPPDTTKTAAEQGSPLPAPRLLVGRERDVERILGMMHAAAGRGVGVITGPPGIGKSTLALAVASRIEPTGERVFVSMRDEQGRRRDIASVLNQIGNSGPPRPGPSLIVLDAVDDLDQAHAVLDQFVGAATLLTAERSLLGLVRSHGAWLHRLRPLGTADAIELLCRLLGSETVHADVVNAHALVRLCAQHPLLLRAAGAFVQAHPHWGTAQCVQWLAADLVGRLSSGAMAPLSVAGYYDDAHARLPDASARSLDLLVADAPESFGVEAARRRLGSLYPSGVEQLLERGWLDEVAPGLFRVDEFVAAAERHRAHCAPAATAAPLASVTSIDPDPESRSAQTRPDHIQAGAS